MSLPFHPGARPATAPPAEPARDERSMYVLELAVAGIAILAAVVIAFAR
jgi:hypothetical protein